jgi:cell volume regulation protein A
LFDIAFVVVLISLLAQGTTVGIAARWLGVSLPPRAEPKARLQLSGSGGGHELIEFVIAPRSAVPGRALEQLKLPASARPVSVMRGGRPLAPAAAGRLCAGDIIALIAPDAALARLEDIFLTDADRATDERQRAFGEFLFSADAPAVDVFALYGIALPSGVGADTTLGTLIAARLPKRPVEGDSVRFGEAELTIAEMDGSRLRRIGLHLPRDRVTP